jgi:lipopolysaccharide export system permease protein|tara:strand:+ start:939 stop:1997 length:1059 start_codon:yes stop_codon:yes gene_type:complete
MNLFLGDLIERNISKKVFVSICVVGISIILLDFLFNLISELSDLTNSYLLYDAFLYCLFLIPGSLYEYLSYICLLGALIGLGSLKEEGEMIGSRVLGKSNFKMAIASMRPALIIILIGFIFQEIALPSISQSNEETRLIKQNKLSSEEGYWFASGSSIANFKSSPSRKIINEITIYDLDEYESIKQIIYSKTAIKEGETWTLFNLQVEDVTDGSIVMEKNRLWNNAPNQKDMRRILSPEYFSIVELSEAIEEEVSAYRKNSLLLEYWRKIFHPIISIFLILLATSFIFGQIRDHNLGQRLLIGIIFAFSLNIIQNLFESMAVVSFLAPLTAVTLPLAFIVLLTFFVWRWKPS